MICGIIIGVCPHHDDRSYYVPHCMACCLLLLPVNEVRAGVSSSSETYIPGMFVLVRTIIRGKITSKYSWTFPLKKGKHTVNSRETGDVSYTIDLLLSGEYFEFWQRNNLPTIQSALSCPRYLGIVCGCTVRGVLRERYHIWGGNLSVSHHGVHTGCQLKGVYSITVRGDVSKLLEVRARPIHPKHQPYPCVCHRSIPHYYTLG